MRTKQALRSLNKEEKDILDVLLKKDFPGKDEIKSQLVKSLVRNNCGCGCKSIEFSTKSNTKIPSNMRVPVEASYAKGETQYQILLHILEGKISELEFVSFGDLPDSEYPKISDLKVKIGA